MSAQPVAKVAPWKREEVTKLASLLKDSPVVAIAKIDKLPSKQFQMVRESVRDHATIRVAKNRLLRLAIEEVKGSKDGVEDLEAHLDGQIAVICSDENPFKLFKKIEGSKAKAPAKAGDLAPHDIEIKKGDTPFKPGPIVGDLQKAGLPAKIEAGKVVIASNKVVAKAGEAISAELAGALARLEIHPMTVGLDVQAVWENGTVFSRVVLDIDEEQILANLKNAHARAFSLAIGVSFPTKATLPLTLAKAVREARAVAIEAAFPASDVLSEILARADAQAKALVGELGDFQVSEKGPKAATAEPAADEATEEATEGAAPDEGETETEGDAEGEEKAKDEGDAEAEKTADAE